MSFFMPESNWEVPSLTDLPSWRTAKRVAIDAETKDINLKELGNGSLRDGHTVGWSFAIDGGPAHYLPIRHEGGDNLPVEQVLGYLGEQTKNFSGELVGANLAYDYDYALSDGLTFHPDVRFRDVQIADPLIYELHRNYSLAAIGERYGVEAKDETLLRDAARALGLDTKAGLWRLPGRYVGAYAERDVTSPLEILRKQEEIIKAQCLEEIWDLETDVLPVLVRMRRRGVRVNFDKLDEIEKWAQQEEENALGYIKRETGVRIALGDVWKPDLLAPALEDIGVRVPRTGSGAPSIDKELLGGIGHPVADAMLRARKTNKLRTTFAASIRKYQINGKIHCTFNQITREDEKGDQKGVRYGRLSAMDPNFQQQPSPDRDPDIAGEWRKIFIPEPGSLWACDDYSQQEPRWTTHFAAVMDLPKAREAARRYQNDPSTDNHEMMTRLIHGDELVEHWIATDPKGEYKVNRGYSKNIFLGVCYGEGGPKLCRDIGKPTRFAHITGWGEKREVRLFEKRQDAMESRMSTGFGYVREVAGAEGQEIMDKFDEEVPYVREVAKSATKRAERLGFVRTIAGRRLHFERREDGTYDYTHKALNRVIQGSSADQTKKAIVEIDRAGHYLQLQVHDETNSSVADRREAEQIGQIMSDCLPSEWVPFKVDCEVGPSWGEIK